VRRSGIFIAALLRALPAVCNNETLRLPVGLFFLRLLPLQSRNALVDGRESELGEAADAIVTHGGRNLRQQAAGDCHSSLDTWLGRFRFRLRHSALSALR
jgi:hypothetical protein